MSGIHMILDDHRGIYIPQNFAEEFDLTRWSGITEENKADLLAGPDNEHYWEAWDRVLNNAVHTDKHGYEWTLWQDGPVWIVCDALMDDTERDNLFGE